MTFTLAGFHDAASIRTFTFEYVLPDKKRGKVIVDASLTAARQNHILVQELPLLCLRYLERNDSGVEMPERMRFADSVMRDHAADAARQLALKIRPKRAVSGSGDKEVLA